MINLFCVVISTMCATVAYSDNDKIGLAINVIAASVNFAFVSSKLLGVV